jgi:protein associated with RNAse G/E
MKKTLKLDQATTLKSQLEKGNFISIDKDNKIIEKNNTTVIGGNEEINIQEIEQKKEMKSELLILLYLAITAANLKKSKNDKNCNAYYIKKLSEFEREKIHLNDIEKEDSKKKETIGKKIAKFFTFIKPKDILKRRNSIEKNITELKEKISNFNKETNISIDITKEMNDFLKSLEN